MVGKGSGVYDDVTIKTSGKGAIMDQGEGVYWLIGNNSIIFFPITETVTLICDGTNRCSLMVTIFGNRDHLGCAIFGMVDLDGQIGSTEKNSFQVDEPTPIPIHKDLIKSHAVDINGNICWNIIENAAILIIGITGNMLTEWWCRGVTVNGLQTSAVLKSAVLYGIHGGANGQ